MQSNNIKNICYQLSKLRNVSYEKSDNDDTRFDYESELWSKLDEVLTVYQIKRWVLNLREYVWGKKDPFLKAKEFWSKKEEEYFIHQSAKYLSDPLFKIIYSDESLEDFISEYNNNIFSTEHIIQDILKNDFIRESSFSLSKNNINLDPEKIEKSDIIRLAQNICNEYSINAINFNYQISDLDCMKYLIDLFHNLESFSNIIKSKNIGFDKLIIAFELDNKKGCSYYSLNFKTIHLDIKNGFGSFSHEWFHFIDHLITNSYENKYPTLNDPDLFSLQKVDHQLDNKFEKMKSKIHKKFFFDKTEYVKSIFVMKLMLRSFPEMLENLKIEYPQYVKIFDSQLTKLNLFLFHFEKSDYDTDFIYNGWKQFLFEAESKLNEYKIFNNQNILFKWKLHISMLESICFDKYNSPLNPTWFIYSKIYDKINGKIYLSAKDEMMARSFEVFVRNKVKKISWLSHVKDYNMTYPRDIELTDEMNWWENNMSELLNLIN